MDRYEGTCTIPSVFIMYAKEQDDPQGEQVLCLSNLLKKCGIDCDIDLYHANEDIMDWSYWVWQSLQFHIASGRGYVILVCSPTMIATLEERNDNVRVEMVASHIDSMTLRDCLEKGALKILPLFINDPSASHVPANLSGKTRYHFPYNELLYRIPADATAHQVLGYPSFASMRSLVATLTGQPENPRPERGQGNL